MKDTLDSQEDSDEDLHEAWNTLELGKHLGLYTEMEEVVLQSLTNLQRSSRKRYTPTRFK